MATSEKARPWRARTANVHSYQRDIQSVVFVCTSAILCLTYSFSVPYRCWVGLFVTASVKHNRGIWMQTRNKLPPSRTLGSMQDERQEDKTYFGWSDVQVFSQRFLLPRTKYPIYMVACILTGSPHFTSDASLPPHILGDTNVNWVRISKLAQVHLSILKRSIHPSL
jgi:hypothetical protein